MNQWHRMFVLNHTFAYLFRRENLRVLVVGRFMIVGPYVYDINTYSKAGVCAVHWHMMNARNRPQRLFTYQNTE